MKLYEYVYLICGLGGAGKSFSPLLEPDEQVGEGARHFILALRVALNAYYPAMVRTLETLDQTVINRVPGSHQPGRSLGLLQTLVVPAIYPEKAGAPDDGGCFRPG